MKKALIILTSLMLNLFIFSCEGPAGPAGANGNESYTEKQIRLELMFVSSASDQWKSGMGLIKFDKRNYPGVDSITFVANITSYDTSSYCIAELFNYNDGSKIENSTIQCNSNSPDVTFTETGNIFQSLPDSEINIGVRVKQTNINHSAYFLRGYLFLYRK